MTQLVLIPQLCNMTGITNAMRSNFNLMRTLGEYTRPVPQQRVEQYSRVSLFGGKAMMQGVTWSTCVPPKSWARIWKKIEGTLEWRPLPLHCEKRAEKTYRSLYALIVEAVNDKKGVEASLLADYMKFSIRVYFDPLYWFLRGCQLRNQWVAAKCCK